MNHKNIFYFPHINAIGGVESFLWQLANCYAGYDMVVYYKTADGRQLERLSSVIDVRRYNGERIQCDKAFFNYSIDIIDNVDAKEYIQIVHADYETQNIRPVLHKKITRYVGVSQLACDAFERVTGRAVELCYNPLALPEHIDQPLKLVSATRLTPEKGRIRMARLCEELDVNGVNYVWHIFTNDTNAIDSPNVIYCKPRLDILSFIRDADYLVQLSDCEAYCYSVVEALSLGTPVIVTPCGVFDELGLNGDNSITLPFDMSSIPVDEIVRNDKHFSYSPPDDTWGSYLVKGESTYDPSAPVIICVNAKYFDLELQRMVRGGEYLRVSRERARKLIALKLAKWVGVVHVE